MTAIQLNFTLRTNPKCRTVHLVGSWDGYKTSYPLGKDSSRDGGWKGTFRFSAPIMVPGARYWYYYIIDGTHVSHDPAREATIEPTTGRKLNILDIPGSRSSTTTSSHGYSSHSSKKGARGRGLDPSQIAHPHPNRPYETQAFRTEKFSSREMEALSRRYAAQRLSDSDSCSSDSDSPGRYSDTSYSSRSSYNSSPSSVSSLGSPITPTGGSPIGYGAYSYTSKAAVGLGISGVCNCRGVMLMKDGSRMPINCGGRICGGSADVEQPHYQALTASSTTLVTIYP
ncbi:hypothetical protein K461DRAFT_183392 [Myriangium duriaei CBS 260.36]|uniref:AMP-activated protein kinase glycogen-binding domain-containing protein n=1 Tax=Myriangium duriaei CBS 260.36 TaxID=1168546 RepID=A0A9P4IZS9_9PEZI|nr:hypothetical protein K461DRAFT_183392 [Myriangium duriaei CBS 260.36]